MADYKITEITEPEKLTGVLYRFTVRVEGAPELIRRDFIGEELGIPERNPLIVMGTGNGYTAEMTGGNGTFTITYRGLREKIRTLYDALLILKEQN